MNILLDTQALIRWLEDRTPRRLTRLLMKPQTMIAVSIVTPWEIAMKPQLRLRPAQIAEAVGQIGARLLPVHLAHIEKLGSLPSPREHRDPFDRMLIAQALSESYAIASADERFSLYPGLNVVWD
jgi:PIN domain nuclease of toxin-antitoxin system